MITLPLNDNKIKDKNSNNKSSIEGGTGGS